jgi:AraC family transcriptional regulator of adaptative response / DNA-3-methyladenine glycosylase II
LDIFGHLLFASWTFSDTISRLLFARSWQSINLSDGTGQRAWKQESPGYANRSTMNVDWKAFRRARLARDVRFDGRFFVGILSTKIYCRPSCPVPTVADKNVRYFATAAAAAEAGFRPCLRCRPECSPGSPAWMGTHSTVSRALRLIAESGLEDGGVEKLAEKLGVGSRHLRRLFIKHLGATPGTVAQTRRLQFAKKLIDETSMPMHQLAIASGFGCVRRFNATIFKTYHRTPTQIRKLVRQTDTRQENQYLFRLRFRPPYNWQGMLDFLAPRCTPAVEMVENGVYLRSISVSGNQGWLEVSFDPQNHALLTRVHFPEPRSLFVITERVRRMFDVDAEWDSIAETLGADPRIAGILKAKPGLRLPGCWDPFELAVRAILGQQISVKGATTFAGRIAKAFGQPLTIGNGLTHLFPIAEALIRADLISIGLTKARAECIRALAKAVSRGEICFDGVLDSEDFVARLIELPGIGRWTAEYIAMRALSYPDAFPLGDIALMRGLGVTTTQELEARAEAWRPWRAYAAIYLWSIAAKRPQGGNTRNIRYRALRSGEPSVAEISAS